MRQVTSEGQSLFLRIATRVEAVPTTPQHNGAANHRTTCSPDERVRPDSQRLGIGKEKGECGPEADEPSGENGNHQQPVFPFVAYAVIPSAGLFAAFAENNPPYRTQPNGRRQPGAEYGTYGHEIRRVDWLQPREQDRHAAILTVNSEVHPPLIHPCGERSATRDCPNRWHGGPFVG